MLYMRDFFKKYNISQEEYDATGLKWDRLMEIYNDYIDIIQILEPATNYIAESLRKVDKVHSVRSRIKDPEHLIEKIIRKKISGSSYEVDTNNYREKITDLIGIRALHLFKEDWEAIDEYIRKSWELAENPKANIRAGDPESIINCFRAKNCEIKEHPFGYRSVHYLILLQSQKKPIIAEIQVRTIFEEGWSEVDHRIRYPYDTDNAILAGYLVIFNRLAGSADEMGSFISTLKDELLNKDKELEEKDRIIEELHETISKSTLAQKEKDIIISNLKKLNKTARDCKETYCATLYKALEKSKTYNPFLLNYNPIAKNALIPYIEKASAAVHALEHLKSPSTIKCNLPGPKPHIQKVVDDLEK